MFRLLHWRIALIYAAMILLATFGSTVFISTQVRQVRLADLEAELLSEARLLASSATPLLRDGSGPRGMDQMARLWAAALAGRVTVLGPDGTTLGESHEERSEMENHSLRPEVQQALKTGQGSSIRFSDTLGYDMMYAAVPIRTGGGQLLGIIRIALPMEEIENQLSDLRRNVMLIGSITALLAALLALLLAERIAQPMRQLSDLTESLKQGDLRTVLIPSPDDEVGQLIQAMVQTFEQIQGRVTSLSTVLDQVADGVLVTEEDGKISLINATAARLIGIEKDAALECSFVEVMPNQPLVDLWRRCGERSDIQGTKVEFDHDGLILQAIVTPFTDESSAGCLVILQDLTNARRQESSRSELIGNISHVLRFSLSRLKTVVDALHSDGDNKLLAVIEYKNRLDDEIGNLSNIAEELLEISRLESRTASLILSPISVAEVVIPPMDRLKPEAKLAGLELTVLLPPDIPQVLADVDRARLALANVVHNAVKFTPPGGTISVVVQPAGGEVLFTVQDNGVGIPAEDLLRVFEWSYQADGAEGGDIDMGLAIAKQIVQGHSGRIWAESIEFQGSTFFFTLPVAGER